MELRLNLGSDPSSERLRGILTQMGYGRLALANEAGMREGRRRNIASSEADESSPVEGLSRGNTPEEGGIWLNSMASDLLAWSVQEQEQRLHCSGLKAKLGKGWDAGDSAASGQIYERRFIVRVFHLKAVEIVPYGWAERALSQAREDQAGDGVHGRSQLYRKLEKTAVRALYALNLDFGEVGITAGANGMVIHSVQAMPDLEGENAVRRFAEAVVEEYERLAALHGQTLLLGMDPEFLLYHPAEGKIIPASRYLDRAGIAGCDAIRRGDRTLYPIAELRPQPSADPKQMLRSLMGALQYASRRIEATDLEWLAGGMPVHGIPLGGHLHFSGVPLTAGLLRTLDNYLTLPVTLLEDPRAAARRPKYGYLGDFRLQSHGGFEYRTLPSFLVSPALAKGVVALAELIMRHPERLLLRPLSRTEVHQAYYSGDKNVLRTAFAPLNEELRRISDSRENGGHILALLDMVDSGRLWDERRDIRKAWKIADSS
ncbi:putative amidoligase domain-containing protein [Paenibacillus tuaregi]|uniref:putative amidoligase domain-containing protein n=1 Tax=Paenibacillus tuaregi TaxID=1816681 RepID=UPI000B132A0D|nr:hypothetical protein [Paenibacillus tuaregi]